MNQEIRVIKRCPVCQWRILDKISPASGVIELKCPKCNNIVKIDLSYRKTVIQYRQITQRYY